MSLRTLLLFIAIVIRSEKNITDYVDRFSEELESIMCDDIRLGGDKCDNTVYGVQDFINSFQSHFDNTTQNASILAQSVINRLNEKLNSRVSFLTELSSLFESNCLKYDYDKDKEYLGSFNSLYFSGNEDRDEKLPPDMEYHDVYKRQVSLQHSTYKLPNDVSYKNKHVKRDAQITELADSLMVDLYDTYCKTDAGNDEYCALYFGTFNGVFRRYPGTQNSKTNGEYNDYDPRFRPWYVGAASGGGKDVVILFDISSYMDSDQLSLGKKAITTILKTLGQSSFVNVVAFSHNDNTKLSCFGRQLVPATTRNVAELINFVDALKIQELPSSYTWGVNSGAEIDYREAFNIAFSMLGRNPFNCRASILVFSQGDDPCCCDKCRPYSIYDPSGIVSSENSDINAVVFFYVLQADCENCRVPEDVTKPNGGVIFYLTGSDLVTKLSAFYLYYSTGESIDQDKIVVTSPYLDFDTKTIMITMAKPVFINNTYFVGVVGTDIPLSFISEVVGNIQIGPETYSFVINSGSELLLHPSIGDASELFSSDSENDAIDDGYSAISVVDVEPIEFTEKVLPKILQEKNGKISIEAIVKQSAGNSQYNGYIYSDANLLYIYSHIGPPSSLIIGIVIYTQFQTNINNILNVPAFGIENNLNVTNINNCLETYNNNEFPSHCLAPFNLFHRLDLIQNCEFEWSNNAQILNGPEMNINDENYNEFFSNVIYSIKYPTYYLQSGLYESEVDALNNINPTCSQLNNLYEITNRIIENNFTNNLPFSGIRNEVSQTIFNSLFILTSLHEFWKNTFLAPDSKIVSIYFGHYQGLHISYPGKIFKASYNPLIRPWYLRAKSYPNIITWTTPYVHAVTGALIIGGSSVIKQPYFDKYPFGVLGFDIEYSQFVTDWKQSMNDICNITNKNYCFLIDSSAFLLYYNGMEYDVTHDDISRKFLGDLEPTLMQSLLDRKYFINETNSNYKLNTIDISYVINEEMSDFELNEFENMQTSFGYNSGTYTIHSIYKTNLYLIYIKNYDLGENIYPRNCPYNEYCLFVKTPGCKKRDEIEKIFIYKEIVQSNTHCKIPMVDVCYDEELEENNNDLNSAIISCRKNGANFKGCVREDNKQTDLCSANCDSVHVISPFYANIFVFVLNLGFVFVHSI